MQYLRTEHEKLKAQVADMGVLQQKYDDLATEVHGLRNEVASVHELEENFKTLQTNMVTEAAQITKDATPRTPRFASPAKKSSAPRYVA